MSRSAFFDRFNRMVGVRPMEYLLSWRMAVAKDLLREVQHVADDLGIEAPTVVVEPGRAIVGTAGVTLYEVGTTKPVQVSDALTRLYVSVDGGMSDNIRPALYEAAYTALVANRRPDPQAGLVRSRVVGKHCESGDVVVRDVDLPADLAVGDGALGFWAAQRDFFMKTP